ncbi:type IV pilin protein [Mycetohabitans sp. B2]|uniref:type IV pilin protein n=1 Tax=Mycetohabitans sp. B2 TaxID=2841274 RepID=UPI001F434EBA|nr:prepilin-type N-terminal cleavage/methylation domain-containing protein [Mycetohabitans sp. B2]
MAVRGPQAVLSTVRRRGMTLVELAVALALVAILATYALPVYREQMRRGMRVAAVSAVYRAAHHVEIQHTQRAPALGGAGVATDPIVLPAELVRVPPGARAAYALRVTGATRSNGGYSVIAEPLQDGPMADDHLCGAFRLDATGQRSNSGAAGAAGGAASPSNPAGILSRWHEHAYCWAR